MHLCLSRRLWVLFAISLGVLSCVRPSRLTPACGPLDHLIVVAHQGLVPDFEWAPDCDIGSLHIGRRDLGQIVWWIQTSDSTNAFRQPLRYGQLPRTATIVHPAVPLQAGVTYEISIGRWFNTNKGRVNILVGQANFSP
jgi:hypothetical protein